MKEHKPITQKAKNFSSGKRIICNRDSIWTRNIKTNSGLVTISLCTVHISMPNQEILNVIFNNAEEITV